MSEQNNLGEQMRWDDENECDDALEIINFSVHQGRVLFPYLSIEGFIELSEVVSSQGRVTRGMPRRRNPTDNQESEGEDPPPKKKRIMVIVEERDAAISADSLDSTAVGEENGELDPIDENEAQESPTVNEEDSDINPDKSGFGPNI